MAIALLIWWWLGAFKDVKSTFPVWKFRTDHNFKLYVTSSSN
jgi:hypothetical protein